MSAHTPGPWTISESDYGEELWFGGGGCGLISVNGWSNGGCKKEPKSWDELKSDARLIAAAPELLEALKKLCELADNGNVACWVKEWDVARAAIAKATTK